MVDLQGVPGSPISDYFSEQPTGTGERRDLAAARLDADEANATKAASSRDEPQRFDYPCGVPIVTNLSWYKTPANPSSGDGGNRTHVRDRMKDGFYERIRHSVSRPSVAIAGEVGRGQPQKMSPHRLRRTSGGDPASDSVESRRGLREPRFTA